MRKSLIRMAILLLILCLFLSSCNVLEYGKHGLILVYGTVFGWMNPFLYRKVTYVEDASFPTLLYDGKKYILEPNGWFNGLNENYESVNVKKDGVCLGWRAGLYGEVFYSYTNTDPLYIYSNMHDAYFFREDYDPKEDLFIIEGAENSIPLTTIMAKPADDISSLSLFGVRNDPIVFLHSKMHPDLRMALCFSFYKGDWYFWCGNPAQGYLDHEEPVIYHTTYHLTDEFRDFLIANNALPELLSTP